MITALISRLVVLVFGTLYPAYASYKAIKTKDIREYLKWIMYWIVFACFTAFEVFADIFLSFWFPFYYELKIVIVLWLMSPATKGSSLLYKKIIHPFFVKREREIDECLAKAKTQGYHAMYEIGTKGMSLATNAIVTTAIKGGNGIFYHLRKSYSMNDLPDKHVMDVDVTDNVSALAKWISASDSANVNDVDEPDLVDSCDFSKCGNKDEVVRKRRSRESKTIKLMCSDISQEDSVARNLRSNVNKNPDNLNKNAYQVQDMKSVPNPSYLPYSPYFPYQYIAPSYYSSIINNRLLYNWNESNNLDNSSSLFYQNGPDQYTSPKRFYQCLLTTPNSNQLTKSSSSPDIASIDYAGELKSYPEKRNQKSTKKTDHDSDSSQKSLKKNQAVIRKKSRKKAAPPPPSAKTKFQSPNYKNISGHLETPNIYVHDFSSMQVTKGIQSSYNKSRVDDEKHLGSFKRARKNKIRKILSKSREILTVWHHEDDLECSDDITAAQSEGGAYYHDSGSSDGSVVTSHSYCRY